MPTPPDALKAARDAVEALPSHLFDRAHTDEIAENLAPDFARFAAQRGREAMEAPFTKALVAEARTQGYREGAEAIARHAWTLVRVIVAEWGAFGGPKETNTATVNHLGNILHKAILALPIPGKLRLSLALILLFIAPDVWGQTQKPTITVPCVVKDGGKLIDCSDPLSRADGDGTVRGWITSSTPSCEPGWSIVTQGDWGPKCAWVLKEPIYK